MFYALDIHHFTALDPAGPAAFGPRSSQFLDQVTSADAIKNPCSLEAAWMKNNGPDGSR